MSEEENDADDMAQYRPKKLPEGVEKEIITEADSSQWRYPKKGDDLTVHYVGTLQDGTKFDSSRDRGEPIKFTLGENKVIKGWEHGFATMKKGEIAKLTIQPQHAYGEAGNPPIIPPSAVLIFEVELVSYMSKDDVFKDHGIIKTIIKEGDGFETPRKGEEVCCNIKVLSKGGDVVQEFLKYETIMGDCKLQPEAFARVVEKVLGDMKVEEKCSLECAKGYVFEDKDELTIEMELQVVYELTDVSFLGDFTVMKKKIFAPDKEYSKPADNIQVTLKVESITDGKSPLSAFSGPKEITFITGAGEACDALEGAAQDMKSGERAILTCKAVPAKCFTTSDDLLGLSSSDVDQLEQVVFHLEMMDFPAQEYQNQSGHEKVLLGLKRKEKGGDLFKKKRFELALMKYKKCTELMVQNDNMSKDCKQRAADLKHIAEMNKAACYLQLGAPTQALSICNSILKTDRNNTKALLRRAKAHFSRHEHTDALRDLERVIELDPENSEAKALVPQVKKGQRVVNKESASAYKTMFENISKVGFGKENKKPPPKPTRSAEPEEEEQSKDHVAVTWKLDHKIEPGEKIFVTGAPELLGAWDPAKGLQMKRTPGPPDYEAMALGKPPKETHFWEASMQLAAEEGRTEYRYVVRPPSGEDRVEGSKHVMQLGGMGGSRVKCADTWRTQASWEPPSEE